MKSLLVLLIASLSLTSVQAQKRPVEYVALAKTEMEGNIAQGARVTVKLHFKIEEGFHTQSHQPSEEYFVPTVLKIEPAAGIKAGTIEYPTGKEEKVQGLDKPLSVYEEKFELKVPLAISAQAKLPATVNATLTYQACKGASCFPPKKLKVQIELKPE